MEIETVLWAYIKLESSILHLKYVEQKPDAQEKHIFPIYLPLKMQKLSLYFIKF